MPTHQEILFEEDRRMRHLDRRIKAVDAEIEELRKQIAVKQEAVAPLHQGLHATKKQIRDYKRIHADEISRHYE